MFTVNDLFTVNGVTVASAPLASDPQAIGVVLGKQHNVANV